MLLAHGAVVGTAQPGLGFKIPLIDTVEKVSVKTSTYAWDKMNSYSFDQQPADLKISVTLRASPDKVSDLYAKFGRLETAVNQVVSPAVNQKVKIVFGRYTAVKAIQERGALNNAIKEAITASLKDDPMIIVESVQLENIEFSSTYLHSIEQRMLAEVEVQKLQQNAEREKVQAQITVTQANAKANAVRAEAQAAADALRLNGEARATNIKLTGEAEAAAIEARAKALGTNPNIVTLVQADRRTAYCRRRGWARLTLGVTCYRVLGLLQEEHRTPQSNLQAGAGTERHHQDHGKSYLRCKMPKDAGKRLNTHPPGADTERNRKCSTAFAGACPLTCGTAC